MKKRPITPLFLIQSLDGKINSGNNDNFDVDKDWCRIDGVKEGLYQYYEIEQKTDLFSLNTGRVMKKIGVNERKNEPLKSPCTFIIIDNKPHLKESGLNYISKWVNKLISVTINKEHPIHKIKEKYNNIDILLYKELNITILLEDLYEKYNINKLTIQSGGNLNGLFLRNNLLDYIHIIIAPLLVGGRDVSTLIDGEGIKNENELNKLKSLELIKCNQLKDSYLELIYKVRK